MCRLRVGVFDSRVKTTFDYHNMHVFPSPHITKKVDLIILFETQITKNIEPHKGLIEDLYAVGNSVQIETSYGGYLDKEKFFNDEELIGCRIDQIEFDAKKKFKLSLTLKKNYLTT